MDHGRRRVVLDTDIGSNVDDALALGMLLGSPEVELVGVTTVYGDTALRARLARRLVGLAAADVPCYAGARETLTGRPVWWAGHEGALFADLAAEQVAARPAADFLVDAAREGGDLDVIAIGPLTNIAAAIKAGGKFRHVTVMGGRFTADQPEHDFAADPEAARVVFTSGIPATVCGLEITEQVRITPNELVRIRAAGRIGVALAAEVEQYWRYRGQQHNIPHDPVAALTLLRPDLFQTEPVEVAVSTEEPAGLSVATAAPSSPVRVVTALDATAVGEEILARICQSASPRRSSSAS